MSKIFGSIYSELYDRIHQAKSYGFETTQFLAILEELGVDKSGKFLDFGCGTGGHMNSLQSFGLHVEGFDISNEMLAVAKAKNPQGIFHRDFKTMVRPYEVVYSLFDVMNYQNSPKTLGIFLQAISDLLDPGGYFIVDSWNLSGVQLDPPKISKRTITLGDRSIQRVVTPVFEKPSGVSELRIDLIDESNGKILETEFHRMRAWTVPEVAVALASVDISILKICDGKDWSKPLEPHSWKFTLVCQKQKSPDTASVHLK
jgi:SAM-dependent methyltransferase